MPKELKKDEKKETANHSKLDTIRTKQNSKILNEKARDIKENTSNKNTANNLNNTIIPKHSNIANSKLNQTLNLKLNLDMINKGIHNINKRGNLMTPKMRKTTYSNFNSNVSNTTGKKIDNTRLLRKSETAKKNLTSNTVTNYKVSNTISNINTNTSVPILFSEENHDQENNFNKENMPKTKNSEKTGISTVNKVTFLKPKPQTAKLRHKSPSQISANTNNDKKISLANSASASANNFISDKIIKKRDNTPKLNILSKKSKSPSSKLKMNKSNSNSNLISQNYLPNHTSNSNLTHTLTSYNSNSKKSLLKTNTCTFSNNHIKASETNFNSNSNKLFKYTEKIIKELEESKIRDDNYLETDTEVNFDNNYNYDYNYNEDNLRIKNVELSEINNILNIEDEKNTKIKIEKNYLSNDKLNRQLHTTKNQSHSNLKVLYNTLNGKVESKKVSSNLNISPLKESNKNSRINLTKKINSKNNKLDLDTKTTRPKSESKRKETPLGNRINNILISNNQSNKNIKKEIKRSNTLKPLKESHSSLNYLTHRRESSRPKSSIKRDLVDSKLNEGSLSTEASSIFRGRFEDYAIGKEIGKGAYAIVKQGLHKPSNKKVAIKIYDKVKLLDTQRKNSVKREIQILKRLDHQNIVKLHEVIDNSKQILLIMELVNGNSLLHFIKSKPNRKIEEHECKEIFSQIVKGISHCHTRNICHRDIKLENIIVDDSKFVKIIDFGFGTVTVKNKLQNFFCGTPSYMPPEIVQKKDYIGESADVWSLGILLYTLLCGSFPFRAMTEKELYGKITKGIYTFPDYMSSSACDLVRKLLSLTATDRPLVEEILSDNWFINFNHSKSNYFSSFHYEKLNTGINNYNTNNKFESISIVERDFKEFKELNHVINTD